MTIQEFYNVLGGDYDEVISRLVKEERIIKYLTKFAGEDSLKPLHDGLDSEQYNDAFRAVHSIKGMCLNLGLETLRQSSSALCEELREGKPSKDISDMVNRVDSDYADAIKAIQELLG